MTLEDKGHAFRLHVLQRAEELGNVSAACREVGISRTLFYRWKKRFTRYGAEPPRVFRRLHGLSPATIAGASWLS